MRYYYQHPDSYQITHATIYSCDHPLYRTCTLYLDGERGLAVIQQRYNPLEKTTYWTEIDPWLVDELYSHEDFQAYFDQFADAPADGLYPTVPVRKIMWYLKMKPIKRERWETVFDHCPVQCALYTSPLMAKEVVYRKDKNHGKNYDEHL